MPVELKVPVESAHCKVCTTLENKRIKLYNLQVPGLNISEYKLYLYALAILKFFPTLVENN